MCRDRGFRGPERGKGGRHANASNHLGAVLLAALAVPSAASAAKNPYTAAGVCGAGYRVIDRHRMYAMNPSNGNAVLLATVVLTYNSATGKNCADTMKRYRVGQKRPVFGDLLGVSLAARPVGPATVAGQSGEFKFFAGPVHVPARSRCVQWGGEATLLVPANFHPRGYYNSAFRSGWEHCS
jgi:hypothetical protein